MLRKQAILGQRFVKLTCRIQQNLDDPVYVPVGGFERHYVDAKAPRYLGAYCGSVQSLHTAEQSPLIVAHRCQ